MLKSELPGFLQYAGDKAVRIPVSIAVVIAFLGLVYYSIRHKRERKDAETCYGLVVTILSFLAAILMYVRIVCIEFWFKHYTFYLFLKGVTIGLIIPITYYIFKSISEKKKKTQKKG